MKKLNLNFYDCVIYLGLIATSLVGAFYSTIHFDLIRENVYGDSVLLFGRGIYAYESFFKGPIYVGTDLAILAIITISFFSYAFTRNESIKNIMHIGFLTIFLYYSASLAFGTIMNRLFIIYLILFGMIFFRLIQKLMSFDYEVIEGVVKNKIQTKGLIVFLIIMGMSVSVWLIEIVSLIVNNRPSELIGMQSTEPTYIFDLAIVAPTCFYAAHKLRHKHVVGLVLAMMMMYLLTAIGMIVIAQTLTQSHFGVVIGLNELIIFVISFSALSIIAFYFLNKTLRLIR